MTVPKRRQGVVQFKNVKMISGIHDRNVQWQSSPGWSASLLGFPSPRVINQQATDDGGSGGHDS